MTELLTKWKARIKRESAQQNPEHDALKAELKELRRQLECIDSCFDMIQDGDMIDSLIYQRSGLMARYEYLLKRAKEQNVVSNNIRISL